MFLFATRVARTHKMVAERLYINGILFADNRKIFSLEKSLKVKELKLPFQFYFAWFKQLSANLLGMEYEEMYTGHLKATQLNTKSLKFVTLE